MPIQTLLFLDRDSLSASGDRNLAVVFSVDDSDLISLQRSIAVKIPGTGWTNRNLQRNLEFSFAILDNDRAPAVSATTLRVFAWKLVGPGRAFSREERQAGEANDGADEF